MTTPTEYLSARAELSRAHMREAANHLVRSGVPAPAQGFVKKHPLVSVAASTALGAVAARSLLRAPRASAARVKSIAGTLLRPILAHQALSLFQGAQE